MEKSLDQKVSWLKAEQRRRRRQRRCRLRNRRRWRRCQKIHIYIYQCHHMHVFLCILHTSRSHSFSLSVYVCLSSVHCKTYVRVLYPFSDIILSFVFFLQTSSKCYIWTVIVSSSLFQSSTYRKSFAKFSIHTHLT